MLPGMVVINPCDYNQTKEATIAAGEYVGPVYLRFGRPAWPIFMPEGSFQIGKAILMNEGKDVSIFATGHLVWKALEAAKQLEAEGLSVELINIHTIKPLDEEAVLKSVAKTKCAVVCEEHNRIGGLGSSIATLLASNQPTPLEFVAVNDSFGESGTPDQLLAKYGLDTPNVVDAVRKVSKRK
jgi:transketolase